MLYMDISTTRRKYLKYFHTYIYTENITTMTKAYETAVYAVTISAIYFALYVGVIPTPTIFYELILPVIPWWGLVSFGCYTLFSLGYGVYTLQDKEDKYIELKEQITEAKTFLKSKGVDVN